MVIRGIPFQRIKHPGRLPRVIVSKKNNEATKGTWWAQCHCKELEDPGIGEVLLYYTAKPQCSLHPAQKTSGALSHTVPNKQHMLSPNTPSPLSFVVFMFLRNWSISAFLMITFAGYASLKLYLAMWLWLWMFSKLIMRWVHWHALDVCIEIPAITHGLIWFFSLPSIAPASSSRTDILP